MRAAAVQYVRKVSGFNKPSRVNQESFDAAIDAVTHATRELIDQLVTTATPKDRAREAERAKLRATLRYG
ncbi:MAG: hypothetical protein JWM25_299 [Thermoleophilia bacterium]|nr:hypothetical protein [Thermoleophilia bacterium]MCZ4495716.1 hypothetical protein [Thermoleophilia bacterium]